MKLKGILLGASLLGLSSCASTNNGGHVVGNPMISEEASKKMAESAAAPAASSEHSCGCKMAKHGCSHHRKKHASLGEGKCEKSKCPESCSEGGHEEKKKK